MSKTRYLTLEQIQRAHPDIPADVIADAQRTCQPSGTNGNGDVLFSERLVVVASGVMQRGNRGRVEYR